jgi:hypothetical protein
MFFLYPDYTNGYSLDPDVVLPTTNGEASGFGYCMQPAKKGCIGFIEPVQLVF